MAILISHKQAVKPCDYIDLMGMFLHLGSFMRVG
jgi:hypothetical protein